jgi:uncharacterized protein involved in response to NO
MHLLSDLSVSPYRMFFPVGIVGLLYALTRMILPFSGEGVYWHREAMIGLFLMPVAVGFLFTAGPKFFASFLPHAVELVGGFALFLSMFVFSLLDLRLPFHIAKITLLLLLLNFLAIRFIKRRSGNPVFSSFVFLGPLAGLLGSIAALISLFSSQSIFYEWSRSLYFHGMFWILFFGVGVKFFPMITLTTRGLRDLTPYEKFVSSSHALWTAIAVILLGSFIIEGAGFVKTAMWVRALALFFMAKEGWLLFIKSPRKGVFTFFLKAGLWTTLLAHFVFPFFPEQRVHLYHLVFTGGFMMGTLLVMGRVSLAHERLPLDTEVKSKVAAAAFFLIYMATWVRATAHLVPTYLPHLQYAAAMAALGVVLLAGLYFWLYKKEHGNG